ncbi:TlpA family protein disulfide reductase [Fodinibius halophilus]|uniref:Uncharacterized protein n=1 Tax=Fodinibius halophilus TaxID=1736908 RepID=A0A6M1T4X4_9BACT|nr:thioredoxin-like domain-containing protein [Fodinibius halophilus]NGP87011.1 hypothetical protein [Fodinibius halophilus]
MIAYTKRLLGLAFLGLMALACSSESGIKKAHISANFSVADSIQESDDYSGIGVAVVKKDSVNANADTLFYATTDSSGKFSGDVTFEKKRRYPTIISRHDTNLGRVGIILADGDSIRISGTLPTLEESFSISSPEHDAMKSYERLNKNFSRIQKYAQAGLLKGDSLRQEYLKFSDIYWDLYADKKGTFASELAGRRAIQLLQGIDNQKMMARLRAVQSQDRFSDVGATIGKNYIAKTRGLDPALSYLDTLNDITENKNKLMHINMERIKLLYDSARVDVAKKELEAFKEQFSKDLRPQDWIESMNYDLNYLSPGDTIPQFTFMDNGQKISRKSLVGTPYILEITDLSNKLYQSQFDRTVAIHSIYKNFGLQVVTLPLNQSQVTVNAFFEERVKPWPVADAQSFDRQKLLEKFNIRLVPTRFLIDRKGKIIRKYVGSEYQDIINGLRTLIKKEKKPAS